MGITLVGIEVCLRVEVGVLRKCSGLCSLVLTYAVVGTEEGTRHTVNARMQFFALVGVVSLGRGHIVTTKGYLRVVHKLHQGTVVGTGRVTVIDLDGDGLYRCTAFLYADFLLLRKGCCVVILGKNGFIAIIHFADLLSGVEHSNPLRLLTLALLVLDTVGKCRSSLVCRRDGFNNAVCPRTVGEINIPVHQNGGLLILQTFDVVWIVYLAVRYRTAVFAQVLVCSARHGHYHDTAVQQLLHVGAWFRGALGCNIAHHLVLLILGQHGSRVCEVHNVVVECLDEVIVGVPAYHFIQVEVGICTVEVYHVRNVGEATYSTDGNTSCSITILEHLTQHHTAIRCSGLWLYHNVYAIYGVVKVGGGCGGLYVFQSLIAITCGGHDEFLSSKHKT